MVDTGLFFAAQGKMASNLPAAQTAAMKAFRDLLNGIKAPNNSLTTRLNKAVAAMRNLQKLKQASPNAAALATANVPAGPPTARKSFITRAVNKLANFKGRLTAGRVKTEAMNVDKALSLAKRWRQQYPLYRPRGFAGAAILGARAVSSDIGTAINQGLEKLGAIPNANYKRTLNRFKTARKTPNKSYILLANELAGAANKNSFISWPVLYKGPKNTTKYTKNIVNWAERNTVNKLRADPKVPLSGITVNNKNLLRKIASNRLNTLTQLTQLPNYATLKRILGKKTNQEVINFVISTPAVIKHKAALSSLLQGGKVVPPNWDPITAGRARNNARKLPEELKKYETDVKRQNITTLTNTTVLKSKLNSLESNAKRLGVNSAAARNAFKNLDENVKKYRELQAQIAILSNKNSNETQIFDAATRADTVYKSIPATTSAIDTINKQLQDAKKIAAQTILEIRTKKFAIDFWKKHTMGRGQGPEWHPVMANRSAAAFTAARNQVLRNSKLDTANLNSPKTKIGLNSVPNLNWKLLQTQLNTASQQGDFGRILGRNYPNKSNRNAFLLNVATIGNKFKNPSNNNNRAARLTRYSATP